MRSFDRNIAWIYPLTSVSALVACCLAGWEASPIVGTGSAACFSLTVLLFVGFAVVARRVGLGSDTAEHEQQPSRYEPAPPSRRAA